jgi:hypothetical protein
VDFGETSDDEDVDDETFFFFSLSLSLACEKKRRGNCTALFLSPFFSSALAPVERARSFVGRPKSDEYTNIDCFLREEERACVVMRIRINKTFFSFFCFCPQRHLFKRRPFLTLLPNFKRIKIAHHSFMWERERERERERESMKKFCQQKK